MYLSEFNNDRYNSFFVYNGSLKRRHAYNDIYDAIHGSHALFISLMPSGVSLPLRVHPPVPDGFVADPKDPKHWWRMDKARCVSPTGRRNYSKASPPLCSSNCLPPPTAVSALYKPSLRYAILGAGFAGLSVAWHLLKVVIFSFSFLACDSVIFLVVSEEFNLASEVYDELPERVE